MWFFPAGSEPDMASPDPDSWGTPYAYFSLGSECPSSHFSDMEIIFDLTFCGDWDEWTYPTCAASHGFPSSCSAFVAEYPWEFEQVPVPRHLASRAAPVFTQPRFSDTSAQAYWIINSVRVFEK